MSVGPKQPALEPAAGFSLESKANRPDRVPLKKGEYSVASRAIALSTYFLSGALAINLSQFLGTPLSLINEDWYNAWIAFTKQSFGLLTMTLTQTFAPTKVIISGDASVRGQLLKSADGNLILDFPERLVLVANHQIYTDWLYLWWIAYCNGMHGRLYIILKESLKKIPILGWGMQLNQFIFLKRNWEQDKPNMATALQKLNKTTDPMWLLLFPEGTNLAPSTRAKSAAWAKKNNMTDMKHVLLPRSTGLHFCLDELRNSVDYIYDCTVAYEGVPRGQYAQDIFTLKAGYLEGRPPKSVSMYWRRFAIKDIPLHNEKAFDLWLTARWREKDLLMEQYLQSGKFPADNGATKYRSGKILRGCGHMTVPIQASKWYEFLQIFAPMGILAMVLFIFYGDLPQRFWKSINKQAVKSGTDDIKKAGLQAGRQAKSLSTSASGLTLDSFFDPDQQEETFRSGAMAVQNLITSPSAQKLLNSTDFIQQFLSDPQKMVNDSMTTKQQSFMQDMAKEEAKRQQKRGSTTAGSVRSGTSDVIRPQGAFWDALNAEEKNRTGTVVHRGQKAKFWDALDAEEKSRQAAAAPQPPKGTFWKDLNAAEAKREGRPPATTNNKGRFWENVKAEENSRYGTVVTLSSNASTAVGTISSGTTKGSAPKLGPKKTATSSIGPMKNPTKAVSISKSATTAKEQTKKPSPQSQAQAQAPIQKTKPILTSISSAPKSARAPASVKAATTQTQSPVKPSTTTSKTPSAATAGLKQKLTNGSTALSTGKKPKQPLASTIGKPTPPSTTTNTTTKKVIPPSPSPPKPKTTTAKTTVADTVGPPQKQPQKTIVSGKQLTKSTGKKPPPTATAATPAPKAPKASKASTAAGSIGTKKPAGLTANGPPNLKLKS
ncbi:hypothetical protein LTR84_005193 [Exophiala bonariae]|uniref:Phospholipid/glycerol acyltransferase domain-containing protein n=1 Tax=Exophiala bonariae TaxID=1690606 RepID=A0AAV9NT10_9EURO|nr:hypothetical protein LTR84_005193 [Exophiala bonariae]